MTDSAAEAARKAFALQLRDLRKDAGLTGRELAEATGLHFTKVSRIENCRQNPSEDDIRVWAIACGAARRISELVAIHREVDQLWSEHIRAMRGGLAYAQGKGSKLYEQTGLLRAYEPMGLPAIVRTDACNTAVNEIVAGLYGRPLAEIEEALAVRRERRALLTAPTGRNRYSILVEAAALESGYGSAEVMLEQLRFLREIVSMPHVVFGVIPPTRSGRRIWPGPSFYIFDDKLVRSEGWTGLMTSRRPDEVAFHVRIFNLLRGMAVYGDAVLHLFEQAEIRLQHSETL